MKRFLVIGALLVALMAAETAGAQQRLVRLTRYEGLRITGISASSGFEVYLEQSSETKVQVEISEELEDRLNLSLDTQGIVRVSLNPSGGRNLWTRNTVMKITVYLPVLYYLRGSGAVDIYANGNFHARQSEISLTGAAELKSLRLQTNSLKLDCAGSSEATISGRIGELNASISGASEVDLNLKCSIATVEASGASDLEMKGEAEEAKFTASSASNFDAQEFSVNRLTVSATAASDVRVWAIEELQATASNASSIRYRGNPDTFNTQSFSAGSIRRID